MPLDNAQVSAALASYAGARESLERLRDLGINFVYTHNYGCEPGSHLGFAEILRAADDVGMLVGFSQPHFSHYDWKAADADQNNGYARHAAFYVRAAQNHPAVVAYAMNHNATGYAGDMNPDLIDGIRDPREARAQANARQARRVEALVQRLDATRVIYHHSSGNLGSMHTINFYPNFVPPQELSDWFEHWATEGVKPLFLCEYGAPFSWDWTMYRGWYKGERAFGSAAVPWEFCLAEWNAQFLGDSAYLISAREAANLRWEARQLAAGKVWHRWDYPHEVGSRDFDERYPVFARYLRENWPAFRTWGVSAISPWEFGHYWKPRPGVDRSRRELPVDWTRLQRAGFSPDYIEGRYERMDLAFERSDWIATPAAEALLRYNRPLLAYVAGRPGAFTSKDHVFRAGESFEKQIVVINNSRVAVEADVEWSVPGLPGAAGHRKLEVSPGRKESVPIRVTLAIGQAPGDWVLKARVRFSTGETQEDEFRLQVLPASRDGHPSVGAVRLALLDPRGETAELLSRLGVPFRKMEATGSLEPGEILVVGKGAMEVAGILPDLGAVREGLKVIVFEQTAEVLEQRLGFRVAEYGLREVFPRVPDHPVLAGLNAAQLRDWRGEGTLVPPRLVHQMHPRLGPTVQRAGLTVPRLWRCGNRGTVASVSIEKPPRGDFLALIDGGFALQYSPLLEFREGRGRIWFCQLDVTGRTEPDPVADQLVRNLLSHVGAVDGGGRRAAAYAGEQAGRDFLVAAGFSLAEGSLPSRPADAVWVLGPGAAQIPGIDRQVLDDFVSQGGRVVSLGLPAGDLRALWPSVRTEPAEHLAPKFKAGDGGPWLAGLGPGEFHHRAPQIVPLFREGAAIVGNGALAAAHEGRVVFCQVEPWSLGGKAQANLRRTFRRLAVGVSRLLANQGMEGRTPLLARFAAPVTTGERRWSEGLYLDMPEEWDDPYRFFRW
ncbi:MAG: hypothetical protein HZC55_16560 [Verrucomicrobia bacterium]|nr:hypothetical protein [Verrucomicrobiota bacterium]